MKLNHPLSRTSLTTTKETVFGARRFPGFDEICREGIRWQAAAGWFPDRELRRIRELSE